jgi:glucose/arabinose dehydrogenase
MGPYRTTIRSSDEYYGWPLVSFGRDYWGGRIFNDQWEELRREPLLLELKQRLRDVRQGRDGFLYVLTAEQDGALLRIEPR